MSRHERYLGIDLGTTQSAIAVFEGGRATILPEEGGGSLVASAVWVDAGGVAHCGERAKRALCADPDNVVSEHKRRVASPGAQHFPASGCALRPQDMARVVLERLLNLYRHHLGVDPERAVISIPASFGLPQAQATSSAAEAAGLDAVELVQEPIAAALAAGWTPRAGGGRWLIYDLGGGTFDLSLLEAESGYLRVVDHAGDPFLGGRDIDSALARLACERAAVAPSELAPREWAALRRAAELAKIAFGAALTPQPLNFENEELTRRFSSVRIDHRDLRGLTAPLIERSARLAEALLKRNGHEAADLERVLLVGGPTQAPSFAEDLSAALGCPAVISDAPMLAVALGAAQFAAANGFDAHPSMSGQRRDATLWLHHPPVTADRRPVVVGRHVGSGRPPTQVRARRGDDRCFDAPVDDQGAFALQLELEETVENTFSLWTFDDAGGMQRARPEVLRIAHGLTLDEPPLSASVGVALADDRVRVYFEKGTPLPARRAFIHRTVDHLRPGTTQHLRVPIVQGEYDRAHLCRSVGMLELRLHAGGSKPGLPAGSEVEVMLELDRSGRLRARARLPGRLGVCEGLAHVLVPTAERETLEAALDRVSHQLEVLRARAFRERDADGWARVVPLQARLDELRAELASGSPDADDEARWRHAALTLDGDLSRLTDAHARSEVEGEALATLSWANHWVSTRGTAQERGLLEALAREIDAARACDDIPRLQRQVRMVAQTGEAAWLRDPSAWAELFELVCSDLDRASDLPRARALADRGRTALARNDTEALRGIVDALRPLLPCGPRTRQRAHGSGLR